MKPSIAPSTGSRRLLGSRRLPLTFAWLLFVLFSLAIFVVGMLRSEPAAAVWGGVFATVLLVLFPANLLSRLFLLPRLLRALRVLPLTATVEAGESPVFRYRLESPPRLPPLLRVHAVLDLRFHERRVLARVRLGRATGDLEAPPAPRGCYRGAALVLVLTDIFGMTQTRLVAEGERRLTVLPEPATGSVAAPRSSQGETPMNSDRRRRGTELMEVRDYMPGDDVRRIHWKLLAHAGRLLVRVEEQVPPPIARRRFVLVGDTDLPVADPGALSDRLVAVFLEVVSSAVRDGVVTEWLVAADGERQAGSDYRTLREVVAGFWCPAPPLRFDVPADETSTLIVAPPASPSAASLVARLGRRAGVRIVVPPEPPDAGFDVAAIFLRDRRLSRRRPPSGAGRDAASRDIVLYRHAGSSQVDVV